MRLALRYTRCEPPASDISEGMLRCMRWDGDRAGQQYHVVIYRTEPNHVASMAYTVGRLAFCCMSEFIAPLSNISLQRRD